MRIQGSTFSLVSKPIGSSSWFRVYAFEWKRKVNCDHTVFSIVLSAARAKVHSSMSSKHVPFSWKELLWNMVVTTENTAPRPTPIARPLTAWSQHSHLWRRQLGWLSPITRLGATKGACQLVQVKSGENFEMTHGRGLPLDTYVLGAHQWIHPVLFWSDRIFVPAVFVLADDLRWPRQLQVTYLNRWQELLWERSVSALCDANWKCDVHSTTRSTKLHLRTYFMFRCQSIGFHPLEIMPQCIFIWKLLLLFRLSPGKNSKECRNKYWQASTDSVWNVLWAFLRPFPSVSGKSHFSFPIVSPSLP